MKYIVEHNVTGRNGMPETVQDLERYLDSNPHPEFRLVSITPSGESIMTVWEKVDPEYQKTGRDRKILIDTCQKAWLKHAAGDSEIGWGALSDLLGTTLMEVMGDEAFNAWMEKVAPEKTI